MEDLSSEFAAARATIISEDWGHSIEDDGLKVLTLKVRFDNGDERSSRTTASFDGNDPRLAPKFYKAMHKRCLYEIVSARIAETRGSVPAE